MRKNGLKIYLNNFDMDREQVIKILRHNQAEIDSYGVKSLALFGLVARGEARPGSDVHLLVEFNRPVGLFGLIALQQYLEKIPGRALDPGTPDSLRENARWHVLADCAFQQQENVTESGVHSCLNPSKTLL